MKAYRIVETYSGFNDPVAYAKEDGIVELAKKVFECRKEDCKELGLQNPNDKETAIKLLNELDYTVEETDIEWEDGFIVVEERG